MSETLLATFYVPVYNGAAYVKEALESIQAQTHEDWECLVIDDGSTDASMHIVAQFRDPRFRVLRQPVNLNVANASNVALRAARGQYLLRLDQDDIAAPTRLEDQAAFLDAHPDVTVCGGAMQLFGDHSTLAVFPANDADIKANLLTAMDNIANPASAVRLEFLRSHNILNDPRFPLSCDYGMWVDCTLAGARFANLSKVVTHYRMHAQQSSHAMDELQKGVIAAKTDLLQAWFADLSYQEVVALEPLLRANGMAFLTREVVEAGLAACGKLLDETRPSVHGENRERVDGFLRQRREIWQAHLAE
jgi:glycosyltransferase involved in cell wall biosynthesis